MNTTAVVKYSMNCNQLCIGSSKRCNVCTYCWKICDSIKQQLCIVTVYCLLERQMHCKDLNNKQSDGPAVGCSLI